MWHVVVLSIYNETIDKMEFQNKRNYTIILFVAYCKFPFENSVENLSNGAVKVFKIINRRRKQSIVIEYEYIDSRRKQAM